MEPHYEGGTGTGKGVVILRIPAGTSESKKAAAQKDAEKLAKAHSAKSQAYTTDWGKYHMRKALSKQVKLL